MKVLDATIDNSCLERVDFGSVEPPKPFKDDDGGDSEENSYNLHLYFFSERAHPRLEQKGQFYSMHITESESKFSLRDYLKLTVCRMSASVVEESLPPFNPDAEPESFEDLGNKMREYFIRKGVVSSEGWEQIKEDYFNDISDKIFAYSRGIYQKTDWLKFMEKTYGFKYELNIRKRHKPEILAKLKLDLDASIRDLSLQYPLFDTRSTIFELPILVLKDPLYKELGIGQSIY